MVEIIGHDGQPSRILRSLWKSELIITKSIEIFRAQKYIFRWHYCKPMTNSWDREYGNFGFKEAMIPKLVQLTSHSFYKDIYERSKRLVFGKFKPLFKTAK